MLFAPDNTLQKGIYPQQMIQSLSYSFSTPHHGPEGYPCPCPMTPTSERPGCQVMPRRSWMIPDVVVEELCRAPAPACRGHHVLTSLQDQTFQCKSTLIILPAFQFCFICGWFIPVSSLGGIFLCTRQASVFQGYFTHGKWCFCCFPKRLSPKKKAASLYYIETTVQIYNHGNVFWHCHFWVRLHYQSVERGRQCLLSYLAVSSLLHISMLWLQFSSYLWSPGIMLSTLQVLKINIMLPCRADGYFNRMGQSKQVLTVPG